MSAVYQINKGVNRAIEFKGIKAKYLSYLGIGLLLLLLGYALGYIAGINSYILLGLVIPLAGGFTAFISRLSAKYGEHGLEKKIAKNKIPLCVKSRTWKTFSLSGK